MYSLWWIVSRFGAAEELDGRGAAVSTMAVRHKERKWQDYTGVYQDVYRAEHDGGDSVIRLWVDISHNCTAFTGLTGGFCFFILMQPPNLKSDHCPTDLCRDIFSACLILAFTLCYLTSGICLLLINADKTVLSTLGGGNGEHVQAAKLDYVISTNWIRWVPTNSPILIILALTISIIAAIWAVYGQAFGILALVLGVISLSLGGIALYKILPAMGKSSVIAYKPSFATSSVPAVVVDQVVVT
jgi:hypothetical protein